MGSPYQMHGTVSWIACSPSLLFVFQDKRSGKGFSRGTIAIVFQIGMEDSRTKNSKWDSATQAQCTTDNEFVIRYLCLWCKLCYSANKLNLKLLSIRILLPEIKQVFLKKR